MPTTYNIAGSRRVIELATQCHDFSEFSLLFDPDLQLLVRKKTSKCMSAPEAYEVLTSPLNHLAIEFE